MVVFLGKFENSFQKKNLELNLKKKHVVLLYTFKISVAIFLIFFLTI